MSKARSTFQATFDEYEPAKGPVLEPFMKTMVEDYNHRHPSMNARYAPNLKSMYSMVEQDRAQLENGPMHFVTTNGEGVHHSAWRFQSHGGEIAAIGIESLDERSKEMGQTSADFHHQFGRQSGVAKAGILTGTGVQKDETSCGAFAMGFLNTFRKHPQHFDQLSRDVLSMGAGEEVRRLPAADIGSGSDGRFRTYGDHTIAYRLLPAHAFKNAHSKTELKEHKHLAPEEAGKAVSKRGESIEQRLTRLTDVDHPLKDGSQEDMNRGSDKKRLHLLDGALEHLQSGGS